MLATDAAKWRVALRGRSLQCRERPFAGLNAPRMGGERWS